MAFFLLSGPDSGPVPGVRVPKAAATPRAKPGSNACTRHLTRPGLLYFTAVQPALLFRIMFLTSEEKGTRTLTPCLQRSFARLADLPRRWLRPVSCACG